MEIKNSSENEGTIGGTMPPTNGEDGENGGESKNNRISVTWGIIRKNDSKDIYLFVCPPGGRKDIYSGKPVNFKPTTYIIDGVSVNGAIILDK